MKLHLLGRPAFGSAQHEARLGAEAFVGQIEDVETSTQQVGEGDGPTLIPGVATEEEGAGRPSFRWAPGDAKVKEGLELCEQRGVSFVAVLGHPEYYPRFGFEPASKHGIRCQWEGVPDEVFRVKIFDASVMPSQGGVAYYRDEFGQAV